MVSSSASSTRMPAAAFALNVRLRARHPVEDLDRQHRELRPDAVGRERNVGERADGDERRGLADGARQREDQPGQDARQRHRQHLVPDRLPLGRAERIRAFANRARHRAQRFARREDHHRQRQQRQRRRRRPARSAHAHQPHEQAEPEQAVDDRRHRGEVGDVELDEPRRAAARAVFLEIDRRRHAERQRQRAGQRDHPDAAHQRVVDAGFFGVARRAGW